MGFGVYQGSVLSPLLFILVLGSAVIQAPHISVPWELLYADDLALIIDTQECISKLKAWKAGMESKGLHVNMKKTMFMVSSDDLDV